MKLVFGMFATQAGLHENIEISEVVIPKRTGKASKLGVRTRKVVKLVFLQYCYEVITTCNVVFVTLIGKLFLTALSQH